MDSRAFKGYSQLEVMNPWITKVQKAQVVDIFKAYMKNVYKVMVQERLILKGGYAFENSMDSLAFEQSDSEPSFLSDLMNASQDQSDNSDKSDPNSDLSSDSPSDSSSDKGYCEKSRLKIIQSPCPRQDALESMKRYSKGTPEEYRKYFIVSRAYSNFLTFILRVYFPEGLLSRGLTFIQLNYFCWLTIETIGKCFTRQRISKLNTQMVC